MRSMRNACRAGSKVARAHASPGVNRTLHLPTTPNVEITTLPNKIRVATEATPGHFSSVGVYIDNGSRYESPQTLGISHLLDRMSFKSTKTRSAAEISTDIDSLGGQIMCNSSRESVMYQSSHFHSGTPLAMSTLADTVLNPLFLPEELDVQREAARYEVREIHTKPEVLIPEILHQVAYQNNTLGNSLMCSDHRLDMITSDLLQEWRTTWFRPERIVVAGGGMPHAELVELVDKHFSSLRFVPQESQILETPSLSSSTRSIPSHLLPPNTQPSLYKTLSTVASSFLPSTSEPLPTFQQLANAKARYTGGYLYVPRNDLDFNHIYLAFEGVPIHDDDVYTLATLQILLGGGGSFSAGGPGKGMYSRLYTHILNHHHHIDHCASFHHIYSDSSLFGMFASFPAGSPRSSPHAILPLLAHQLSLLLHTPIPETELNRAKNQLQSSLIMALESRAVEVEDLGRQILVHGRKVSIEEMCQKIRSVSQGDIQRVASKVFGAQSKGATVVVMGSEDADRWQSILQKYGIGK